MSDIMEMIESLKTARLGNQLRLPPHLSLDFEGEHNAELLDESTGVMWFLFFPDLHLYLCEEHRADLDRSLEWYARANTSSAAVS